LKPAPAVGIRQVTWLKTGQIGRRLDRYYGVPDISRFHRLSAVFFTFVTQSGRNLSGGNLY
jgi:hypothetical protein